MLETILFKIIHISLLISLVALCYISYPQYGNADSLWKKSKSSSSKMLFTNTKASKVGDIVTIIISENTKSKYDNKSDHKKKSSVVSSVTNLLFPAATAPSSSDEMNKNKPYIGSRMGMHNGTLPSSKWSGNQSFKGEGKIENESNLTASITARVIEELPNDLLLIEGSRTVSVGEEEQKIIISGIIRKEDIAPDNTINSKYIANAKINVIEKGPVASSEKKGILTKLWEFLGIY